MIDSLTQATGQISAGLKTLDKVLRRRDLELPDLPAAEALIALTTLASKLDKITAAVKSAAGLEGPLFDQES